MIDATDGDTSSVKEVLMEASEGATARVKDREEAAM